MTEQEFVNSYPSITLELRDWLISKGLTPIHAVYILCGTVKGIIKNQEKPGITMTDSMIDDEILITLKDIKTITLVQQ